MNKKIVRSSDAYLLSFLIPVLSMIVIFFARGIFPFGRESFLRTDMYHQYAPFFSEFQYKLRHGGSLLYSWNVGLGVNFSALYSYYLASPVNFLILLVPKKLVIEFMTYLIVLKIGLSGLSAAFYFRKHYHRTNFGCCFFGILYAMSGYVAAYSWNIMWLDCILLFPLILLGMERMLSGGSPVLYTLTLGLSILSNYYISIMICLFLFLSFLSYLILDGREGLPFLLRRAGRFFLYSLIAGGLAAVTLLPEIYALKGTASGDINFPETAKQYFGIIDMFARHMPLVETEQGLDHWPNLYSGTVTFLLLPMYFLNGKISLRKKLASGLLLLFFYLSFSINILNFIWHGLHYPNSLPCRQSFLYIFMLLCLCYEAYLKRKATGLRELGISLASALSFIILCQKVVTDDAFHWAVFYTAILFVLLYYLLFYLEKKGGLNYNALLLSALALLGMECAINMAATSVTTTSRTSYTADNADTIRLVRAARAEDKSFCRFEKMTRKTKDDGAFLNFPSVSIFSSTAYKECSDFFRKIGCEASTNAYSITGSTPLVNMLFSVKYDIYSEEPAAAEKRGLSYRDGSGEMLLYQNEYSLPPGLFLREEELTNWHTDMGTPALVQNSFCDAMQSSPVLIPVIGNFQEKDYSFTADTAGEYYVYVTNPKLKQVKAKLASGEKSFENVDRGYFLELGYLSEGEEVRLTADTAGQSMDCEAYRFDFTALKELYRKLSGRSWEPKLHTDTKLSGSATPSEDSTLLLFVPYDEGWSARVDGRKVKPVKTLNCFLGIPLDAGVHEITLSYFPKGLFLGILCSILSLCLFLLLFFLSRRSWREGKWKRREKRYRGAPDFIALTSERANTSEEDEFSEGDELPEEDEFSEGDEFPEENELPEEDELPAGGEEVREGKEDSPSFSEEREPEERGVFSDFEDLEDCEELEEYGDPEDCEELAGEEEPEEKPSRNPREGRTEEEAEAEEPEDFSLPLMEEERAAGDRAAAPEFKQGPEKGGSEPEEKPSRNPREDKAEEEKGRNPREERAEKKRGRNPRRNEAEAEEMELEDLFAEELSELSDSGKSEGEEKE